MKLWPILVGFAGCLQLASLAHAYPTDAYEDTGIRRLPWQKAIDEGERRGRKTPPGARWPTSAITLRMAQHKDFNLSSDTPKDPELQAGLEAILKRYRWRRYNVAILDISEPAAPRFAAVNEAEQQTPGSVAKILVAAGLFNELKKNVPSLEKRRNLLKSTMVTADDWAMPNSHEVPVVNGDKVRVRRVLVGDTFSLWEWLDHALSPSSNAAASMTWREATLMRLLGREYPPEKRSKKMFQQWDRDTLTDTALAVVREPLELAGLDPEQLYLRMFFTKGAGKYIKSGTSRASPLSLLQYWLRVEQGRMVDEFSSLEIKRLMYLTRRRIRYVDTPALNDCAVYFKSGSLYGCHEEPGYTCGQYRGNSINVLNSLTLVEVPHPPTDTAEAAANANSEQPPQESLTAQKPVVPKKAYMVAVMSNELKRNAATDHGLLASAIHELILKEPLQKDGAL